MTAYCTRCLGFGSMFAPTSRRIVRPLRFGSTTAIAGRSTPARTPSVNMAIAIAAPVLPAEMKASASPSRTSSAATRIDESRFRRRAGGGGSHPDAPRRGALPGRQESRRPTRAKSPRRVGTALGALDSQDLPPLVVAAVRADVVRQLALPALGADGHGRPGQLVMGAALAAAGPRVTSLGQRHA